MRHFVPLFVVGAGMWLLVTTPLQAAQDEFWLCHRQDGSEIYTNDPASLQDCKHYTPASKLTPAQKPDQEPRSPSMKSESRKFYERSPVKGRPPEEKPRPKGHMAFETFRMLSTGMTEAEVLVRAGSPKYIFHVFQNTYHWVYTQEDWLVEITIAGGRVANIAWYRPRP